MTEFKDKDLQSIADGLRIPCTPEFKNQLVNTAESYFSTKNYWENRESTTILRTDLHSISKQAKGLIKSLEKLSPLGRKALNLDGQEFERTVKSIRHLKDAAENEKQFLKFVKAGPTENVPLILFMMNLAMIYHNATGKEPGISSHFEKIHTWGSFSSLRDGLFGNHRTCESIQGR